MYQTKEHPLVSISENGNDIVEVTLIKFQLTRRFNLYNTLLTYAVDSRPLLDEPGDKVIFRFTHYDWSKTLRRLLDENLVSVIRIKLLEELK